MVSQCLHIPPIPLDWSPWYPWSDLQRSTAAVVRQTGVYEVKYKDASEDAMFLHIGKAGNKRTLQSRVYAMVHGRTHSTGTRILRQEKALDNLVVRWAATERPSAAEEELPFYDRHT